MASTIRGQYDYLYEVDPDYVESGSEMESQIGQFCELSYAYQYMCPNPDSVISSLYTTLCAPTTMQSGRRFREEKVKKVVTKPKEKCFVKTEWELYCYLLIDCFNVSEFILSKNDFLRKHETEIKM
jgi:hypothetical protein